MGSIIASAPGSLMILGEHAVLHGQPAVVASLKDRIVVKLIATNSDYIEIHSDRMGQHQVSLESLAIAPRFEFVTAAILEYKPQLTSGFKLEIHSEFADTLGLGSSAAVTIATLAVLARHLKLSETKAALLEHAQNVLQAVQKTGSGADMIASIWGGILFCSQQENRNKLTFIEPLQNLPPIKVIYLGYKTPTPEVIKFVDANYQHWPQIFASLFTSIGNIVASCKAVINAAQWNKLGELFFIHQHLQAALGVSSPAIEQLITKSQQLDQVYGCKISGAGMGDCIIILGNPRDADLLKCGLTNVHPDARILDVKLDTAGVRYE